MDAVIVAFIALQAVVLGIAIAVAVSRTRELDQVREVTGAVADDRDAVGAVRRLAERADAGGWEAARRRRDLASLVDLVNVGIVHLDDDLRVDMANRAADVFLDRAPGSMLGRTAIEAFVDERFEAVALAAREGGSASDELTTRQGDRGSFVVRARRSPTVGVWLVIEDVSELRRLQQIRAEFIDNLSHEIRTPLTNLSLLAETLSREADAVGSAIPPRMRERIGKIEVETGHLIQMVTELMDLSRIEAGGSFVPLDDVDLHRVVTASTERLRLFADRQGVRLAMKFPARPLPPVRGDEERIGQVLVNLLHNAVKFSPDGGDVVVRVEVGRGRGTVVTSVEDHGIGIPRADRSRIFERFYKVDRARVRGGGTGLGLAIARHIVEQHGGRIWVESVEGSGATFRFELPVPAEPSPDVPAEPVRRRSPSPGETTDGVAGPVA